MLGAYLVFNLNNPTGGTVQTLAVRQALATAVDRATVVDVIDRATGGARAQHGVLLPGNLGHPGTAGAPTPDGSGDWARARELLADAGHRGLRLIFAVPHSELHLRVARALGDSLWPCGVRMHIRSYPRAGYHRTLRSTATAAGWDIALADWTPLWNGDNGRTAITPLLRGGEQPGEANVGWYSDEGVDRLIAAALREPDAGRAAALWREVDIQVARDLPIVPLVAVGGAVAAARSAAASWARWALTGD
jgi:peptide/nickel transport system substrate-binding protein